MSMQIVHIYLFICLFIFMHIAIILYWSLHDLCAHCQLSIKIWKQWLFLLLLFMIVLKNNVCLNHLYWFQPYSWISSMLGMIKVFLDLVEVVRGLGVHLSTNKLKLEVNWIRMYGSVTWNTARCTDIAMQLIWYIFRK